MSWQYDLYLQEHKENVAKGFYWIQEHLPKLLESEVYSVSALEQQICFNHDASKSEPDEYIAYDAYFYGGNRSFAVKNNFDYAWLLHQHKNPHHWQFWVLVNDEPEEGMVALDMTYNYILEMICDWWSFSWSNDNLLEIFDWYDKHKEHMKLSDSTRKSVVYILNAIEKKLAELTESEE